MKSEAQKLLRGRIRNAKKLLRTAALIMSVMLISSSFVTAILIPPQKFAEGGEANGRAIAYLAHRILRRYLRHGLRSQHDPDSLVCGRVGDGGFVEHRAALFAALWNGAGMGQGGAAAGDRDHRDRFCSHVDLQRRRRRRKAALTRPACSC